jgi:hypothetical protein
VGSCRVRGPQQGEDLLRLQGKGGGWLSDTAYVARGKFGGGDVWVRMCRISLGVVELRYVSMVCMREVKKLWVGYCRSPTSNCSYFLEIFFEGQGGFNISKCELQRTHEETLCTTGRNTPFQASCTYYYLSCPADIIA